MSAEIKAVWQELLADFSISTPVFVWQLAVIVGSLLLAWSIRGLLRNYVMRYAPDNWKVGIDGINRALFPLTSLLFVSVGQLILHRWQHTGMLRLAATLLLAMAVIRLAVYALRYIFVPSGWMRAMENTISAIVWSMLALHLSGLLPELLTTLEEISFGVGKHPITLLMVIQALFTVLIALVVALWASTVLENKLMRAEHISINMRVVLSKLLRIILSLIAILLALSAIGFDITLLSVFGGALGVGIGLGLQKVASNYVSGFVILTDKSMQIGDIVTVGDHYGVVSELRSRYMVLRKLDGTRVVIPNEVLITNIVINHSFMDHGGRIEVPVQVSYESPLELAMKLMQKAATNQPRILKDPVPEVQIRGFGENGINLVMTAWVPDPKEGVGGVQAAIFLEIWQAFQKNNISIPYPQREIRILGDASK